MGLYMPIYGSNRNARYTNSDKGYFLGWILGSFLLITSDEALAQLPREMVESLSLEVFKNHGDVALRDVVSGHGGKGLGLDLVLEVFFNSNDSLIHTSQSLWIGGTSLAAPLSLRINAFFQACLMGSSSISYSR